MSTVPYITIIILSLKCTSEYASILIQKGKASPVMSENVKVSCNEQFFQNLIDAPQKFVH